MSKVRLLVSMSMLKRLLSLLPNRGVKFAPSVSFPTDRSRFES